MKYKYTSVPTLDNTGRETKRPFVEVEIFGPNNSIKALGLVDSGADEILMHIGYAKLLQIEFDNNKTKQFIGIGDNPMTCYLSNVTIGVEGFDHKIPIELIPVKKK